MLFQKTFNLVESPGAASSVSVFNLTEMIYGVFSTVKYHWYWLQCMTLYKLFSQRYLLACDICYAGIIAV